MYTTRQHESAHGKMQLFEFKSGIGPNATIIKIYAVSIEAAHIKLASKVARIQDWLY
jgi:hypothetical protein